MAGFVPQAVSLLLKQGSTVGIIGGAISFAFKAAVDDTGTLAKPVYNLMQKHGEKACFAAGGALVSGAIVVKDKLYEHFVEPKLLGQDVDVS